MKLKFFVFALVCLAQGSCTQDKANQTESEERPVSSSIFNNADSREVAEVVSEISGQKFVFHPSIDANMSWDLTLYRTPDAVYQSFLSVLREHQYRTVVDGEQVYVIPAGDQPEVDRITDIVRNNNRLLGDVIRPLAVFMYGWVMGIRVYPGSNRSRFDELGFEPGDLIVEFDGHPLLDAESYADLIAALDSSDDISVGLYRAGEPIIVHLP